MDERPSDEWSKCRGCDGTGTVKKAQAILSVETGQVSTVIAQGRCLHCRDNPGWQRGSGFPA